MIFWNIFIELAIWLIGIIVGFYSIAHLVMWIRGEMEVRGWK